MKSISNPRLLTGIYTFREIMLTHEFRKYLIRLPIPLDLFHPLSKP